MTTNAEQLRQWDAENDEAIRKLEAQEPYFAAKLGAVRHEIAKRKAQKREFLAKIADIERKGAE